MFDEHTPTGSRYRRTILTDHVVTGRFLVEFYDHYQELKNKNTMIYHYLFSESYDFLTFKKYRLLFSLTGFLPKNNVFSTFINSLQTKTLYQYKYPKKKHN